VPTVRWTMINAIDSSLGKSPEDLFIGAVKGSSNNVRMPPLTASFILSTPSQGYYSYFTSLTTLCRAYSKATCVIPGYGLHLMTLFGPSAPNRHPTPVTAFSTGLCLRGCSWPLLLSSSEVVKQGLVHELVNAKLIVLSDARGASGAETGINP
jgi:hypothetical protein